MNNPVSRLLLATAIVSTLSACAGPVTPGSSAEQAMACRETGLTDAKDSKMGLLECTPVAEGRQSAAK